jgi:uncharacterized protein (DUF427 family)
VAWRSPRALRSRTRPDIGSRRGEASYKTIVVDGHRNADAAWYYPEPKDADYGGSTAAEFKDRFAFWHGVTVEP